MAARSPASPSSRSSKPRKAVRRHVDELLKEYRAKRDFSRTAEPDDAPKSHAGRQGAHPLTFVVQKHDATRLHYDFRLEWDGVLKSWAVTRGPSYDPADKRLAVRTEDHPLAYGTFEGVIPEGEYGGGTVMLWDRGTWEPVGDFATGMKQGKFVFRLTGERLVGEWTLVRMKARAGEKRENWLLIKHREDGQEVPDDDVLETFTTSVGSDLSMEGIAQHGHTIGAKDLTTKRPPDPEPNTTDKAKPAAGNSARKRKAVATKRTMPAWREPQLATLVGVSPEGGEWLSEMKYDGYRALIGIAGGQARIYTRSGLDWTDKFPSVAAAAAALPTDGTLLDGEIVAFDDRGRTDFSSLQAAIRHGGDMSCFLFDMLEEGGEDISALPLVERKARLERLVGGAGGPLLFSQHIEGKTEDVFAQVCKARHEGIVAKRADEPYRGDRSKSWLKIKCGKRQEFVIGGWSKSDKPGRPFSSILIGVREGDDLVYKGRVGSFEGQTLDELWPLLEARALKTSPFASIPREVNRGARFVRPDLVAEIDFAEFTADGVVRHGVFKGLREDKEADDVVLETPGEAEMSEHETRDTIAGVKLSSPGKVLFAEQGVTKADLAAHYERVAERILPHVSKRLLSLVRCPEGAAGECFFQKHESRGFPKQLKKQEIEENNGKRVSYLYVDDLAGLIAGVQMGTLEFHIWGSRIDRLEHPDRLVFDLDPDEGLNFADVRAAAVDVRDRLEKLGLKTVPMVTGGKGVHVVAPLQRKTEWTQVKAFAHGFATKLGEDDPELYVANMAKAKRKGRIFVDYLRNERGSTAICPYSTRARKGAPVAVPVSWEELSSLEAANLFHIADMEARMAAPDPWAEAATWRQALTKPMLAAVDAGSG